MNRLEFFMPMRPPTATAQEKQWRVVNGKPMPYEPQPVKQARAKLGALNVLHEHDLNSMVAM